MKRPKPLPAITTKDTFEGIEQNLIEESIPDPDTDPLFLDPSTLAEDQEELDDDVLVIGTENDCFTSNLKPTVELNTSEKDDSLKSALIRLEYSKEERRNEFDPEIRVWKIYPFANMPHYMTKGSACFDLFAYLGPEIKSVTVYDVHNTPSQREVIPHWETKERGFQFNVGERAMVPTGLVFDIPIVKKMLVYPRSGLSLKRSLSLKNCVGVIDHDYVEELMIILHNDSEVRQFIVHNGRYAQAEIVPAYRSVFTEIPNKPDQKTDRNGGMGSTR